VLHAWEANISSNMQEIFSLTLLFGSTFYVMHKFFGRVRNIKKKGRLKGRNTLQERKPSEGQKQPEYTGLLLNVVLLSS
jgi:hypothetical protein